jgi:hypothetical protein
VQADRAKQAAAYAAVDGNITPSVAEARANDVWLSVATSVVGTNGRLRSGRACPLCLGISDIDLFRYCQGIVDFDAEISDRVSTLVCS